MSIRKNSAKSTVFQIVLFLILVAGLILFFKEAIATFYLESGISNTGLIINSVIIGLFVLGMIRILMTLFRYIGEHHAVLKMVSFLKDDVANPSTKLPEGSMIVKRYQAVQWVAKQGGEVNQAALASSCNAAENTRLTAIRFVHSTLILAGVFGTVVSLSMALIGAAGLLGSPEGVKEMGSIVGGMSSALSSTITAIFCFFIFAYFYLRLNDSRIQLLTNIEDVTSLYMLPKISQTESSMVHKVSELTQSLNEAADRLIHVEHTFMNAGLTLQNAVNDLQGQISNSSLNEIKGLIRKGFHLSEPEYDMPQEALVSPDKKPESESTLESKSDSESAPTSTPETESGAEEFPIRTPSRPAENLLADARDGMGLQQGESGIVDVPDVNTDSKRTVL